MKITLTRAAERYGEIYFSTAYGEGKGQWLGASPFVPGAEYEAELELQGLFIKWVDLVPAPGQPPAISIEGNKNVLTGTLEDIEEDGTAYMRLGESLIMFECLGEPMAIGGTVELTAGILRIYPAAY
ncbi:hypothetical protein G5B47_18125 [Paenibacillus sp. 7124]|uniref:Uncharacterized protein n=1 Tax=Paenibacillus apii TaxID=1850370 RepID=A0A6M1PLI5_9BACL|nr:hypothetical protein [Paenibacillus apii]NGM84329.1 hypothetical protein [Paenibacillus apii]NJJ38279.1 hypothetical protein [Paenibacillus apii]